MKIYKNILLVFILMISVVIPSKVFALSGSLNLSCGKTTLKAGDQTTCNLSYSVTSGEIKGFQTNVSLSNNLEMVSSSKNAIWDGSANNGNFYLYTAVGKTGSVSLGTFNVKAKDGSTGSSESITLTNVIVTDESYNDLKPGNKTLGITIPSNNANLSSLSVNTGTLSPAFTANVTNYSVTTNAASITISATAVTGTVSGLGTKNLNYGSNTFNVVVTAPAGNTKTYRIVVTRNDTRSNDSKLKSLTVSSGKISFNAGTTNYDLAVEGNVSTFSVTGVQNDSKAKIQYSPSQSVNLNYGQTSTISIVVTAENGTTTTYKVNVTRKDNRSTNNNLKSLTVSNTKIKFNSSTTSYSETVENNIDTIKIDAVAEDSKSKVTGTGAKTLKEGSNTFNVVVTAENGSAKTYTITVIRKPKDGEELDLSSDNNLKSLKIDVIELDFNKDKTTYNLSVENNIKKINITYEVSHEKASVSIIGSTDLKEGTNKIDIVVTAENGTTKTYNLIIERRAERITVANDEQKIIEKLLDSSNSYNIYVTTLESDENKKVSPNLLNQIISSKKKVIFEVLNENNGIIYSFEFDGNKIKNENEFSYVLTFVSEEEELLKQLTNNKPYLSLNFNNGGKLENKIKFKIFIGDKLTDLESMYDLYYFNKNTKKLELLVEGMDITTGYIEMEIDKLEEYVLVKQQTQKEEEKKSIVPIIILSAILVIIISLIVVVLKKGKN